MASDLTDPELDKFLKKIDEIESIVKGLNSEDPKELQKSMLDADIYTEKLNNGEIEVDGIKTKTGYNKTIINKSTSDVDSIGPKPMPNDQNGFLAALEQDAKERYERRKQNEKIANELKDKGNSEFSNLNYEKAIEYYTEAISKIKDMTTLYTNRAQAYIKLGKHEEAISDCEWAFRVDENCLKAFIHKGRALTYLKKFDDAINQFERAKQLDLKQANSINEYIKEVERCRNTDNQEKSTKSFLENQNNSVNDVVNILNKIYKVNQPIIFYAGGLRSLVIALSDITQKTLFRAHNGFKLATDHFIISRCLYETKIESLKAEEIDLLSSFFELCKTACKDCDENMKTFYKINQITSIIESSILSKDYSKILNTIRNDFINLLSNLIDFLFQFSITEYGRQLIIDNFDSKKLSITLLNIISTNDRIKIRNDISLLGSQIVQNLTVEKRFIAKLYSSKDDFQIFIDNLNKILENNKNYAIELTEIILIIVSNLLTVEQIRNLFIDTNSAIWSNLLNIFKENHQYTDQLLLIFINLCSKHSQNLSSNGDKMIKHLYELLSNEKSNEEKLLILIGNIIQNNKISIKQLELKQLIKKLVKNIKSKLHTRASIKVLALLTQHEIVARKILILQEDKSLEFLYDLFKDCSNINSELNKNFKENEVLINNTILCMTHCVDENDLVAVKLTKTNIVMDLLYLTRDMNKKEAQKTCAILLAKLAKKDEKHLSRLRELHGIEILHSALKGVEI